MKTIEDITRYVPFSVLCAVAPYVVLLPFTAGSSTATESFFLSMLVLLFMGMQKVMGIVGFAAAIVSFYRGRRSPRWIALFMLAPIGVGFVATALRFAATSDLGPDFITHFTVRGANADGVLRVLGWCSDPLLVLTVPMGSYVLWRRAHARRPAGS